MANVELTGLAALSSPASGDLLAISDVSTANDDLKKITLTDLFGNIPVNTSIAGTLDVTGATALTGNVSLDQSTQTYRFEGRSSVQILKSQSAGGVNILALETADEDGTDNLRHELWAVGGQGGTTDRERAWFGYDSASNRFEVVTEEAGTGTLRPLHLYTGSNTDQLVLNTDGSISTTRAATLDTGANGSSFGGTLEVGSTLFVNETANANMTTGLTINQGAADDEILALKSSDVAHGMTDVAETDTYVVFQKKDTLTGGVTAFFLTEDDVAWQAQALYTNDDTGKTTSALGAVRMMARKKSGTSVGSPGADANLMVIQANTTTRFIFDAEGSFHADVGSTTFDHVADLQVIEDLDTLLAPGQVDRRFSEAMTYDRDFFIRENLFHDIREEGGQMRGMMNVTRMIMLHNGALREVGGMVLDTQDRTAQLERALTEIVEANPDLPGVQKAAALLN